MLNNTRVNQLWRGILAVCVAMAASALFTPNRADGLQIGAAANGSSFVHGVRGVVYEPSAFTFGEKAKAYWLGVTFPDGTFFQAGFLDASNTWGSDICRTGFSTFVTALRGSSSLFPDQYNIENCNVIGNHYFRLGYTSTSTGSDWQWYMSGNPIGPELHLSYSQYHFLRSNSGVISEIVYVGNIGNSAGFPTVRYNPALEFPPNAGPWAPAANAREVESSDRTCRYAIKVVASNDVKTGIDSVINAPTCYSLGATLW